MKIIITLMYSCLAIALILTGLIISWFYDPLNLGKDVYIINENTNVSRANGYYVYGDYYLISTEKRSTQDIVRTTMHEHCHYLIHDNRQHFCEEGYK